MNREGLRESFTFQHTELHRISRAGIKRPARYMAPWRRWLSRRPVTAEVTGSSPVGVARLNAYVAQLEERLFRKQRAAGSIPAVGFMRLLTNVRMTRFLTNVRMIRFLTNVRMMSSADGCSCFYGFIAQLVERAAVNREVEGSNPSVPAFGSLAQPGERLSYKQKAAGSIPAVST